MALRKAAAMKTHTTAGHISLQVLEGTLRFETEQQLADLGEVLALHAGIPYGVVALAESTFLLTLTTTLAGPKGLE